jgi:hypothetical protein
MIKPAIAIGIRHFAAVFAFTYRLGWQFPKKQAFLLQDVRKNRIKAADNPG